MTDIRELRIFGVYAQRQSGFCMMRIKFPGGRMTPAEAAALADIADGYARGVVHLTTRGSIQLHYVPEPEVPALLELLHGSGFTTRGGCGGAVRSIACGDASSPLFPAGLAFAAIAQRRFLGPDFEGLPKKFKVGVFTGMESRRHLVQDAGVVLRHEDGEWRADLWGAGGLGRAPAPGRPLLEGATLAEVLRGIEALVSLYSANVPQGKRLKMLAAQKGDGFRPFFLSEMEKVAAKRDEAITLPEPVLMPLVEIPVFGGELPAAELRKIGASAAAAGSDLIVTAEQNLLLSAAAGEASVPEEGLLRFRICPGSHECRMGLSATRDVGRKLCSAMPAHLRSRTWALSGCPNSCAQPQLAEIGIVTSALAAAGDERKPLYDLYVRGAGNGFADKVRQALDEDALLAAVAALP